MKQKYELTDETLEFEGVTLHRLRALQDLDTGVRKGQLGGWIQSEDNLTHEGSSWVGHGAKVLERAYVGQGIAMVNGFAVVRGEAEVTGSGRVYGGAQVYGRARINNGIVHGRAKVFENASVEYEANVSGDAQVFGNARVSGGAEVYGNAAIFGNAQLWQGGSFFGDLKICGNTFMPPVSFGESCTIKRTPLFLSGLEYPILLLDEGMEIGCTYLTYPMWSALGNKDIEGVATPAYRFWQENRLFIRHLVDKYSEGGTAVK